MRGLATQAEPTITRRVFEAWSIEIPASFDETFVHEDGYWHGYKGRRSVSLTSMVVDEHGTPVNADRILGVMVPLCVGTPVNVFPAELPGWAVTSDAPPDARASRILSGMLAVDGRVLLATITTDDLDWARRTWLSIRNHAAPLDVSPGIRRLMALAAARRAPCPNRAGRAARRRASPHGRGR